jgi:DNA repair protein RecN (Recombination protein N)
MPKAQLVELFARSLGVIEEARIEFGPDFNVITGETGAGKTLLLGALELCLGGEAAASRYAVNPDTRAVALFSRDDGSEVLFARESTAAGRLRAVLDGAPSSAELLRQAALNVIVIHGQHDSLSLKSRQEILRIIDVAGEVSTARLDAVRRELAALATERDSLGGDAAERERERDYLVFQCHELTQAQLADPDELGHLLEELTRLSTLRDAEAEILAAIEDLDGDAETAILSQLARVIQHLPNGAGVDDVRRDLTTLLESARAEVHELRDRSRPDQFDPERIAVLDERATLLQHVARKYGGSVANALSQRDEMTRRIDELASAEDRLVTLDARVQELRTREATLADEVRLQRQGACEDLTTRVSRQLPRVALPHAALRFSAQGADGSDAQIFFTPNPGWPEGPLQSLASGGELSRVLLALSLETALDDVVAVFDEVDAGVGGQVAQQIGECLREVGESQQVIAVTHLASVAAKASHHFVIEKTVNAGVTTTRVRPVSGEERVREVARMLAGDAMTDEAHALARRLLESVS